MGHMPGEPPPPPGTGAGQQVASSRGRLAAVLVKREAPTPRGSFAPLLRSLGLRTHARTRTRTCECTDGRTRTETSTRTQVAGQDHMTTPSVTTCHVNYPFRQNEFSAPPPQAPPLPLCRAGVSPHGNFLPYGEQGLTHVQGHMAHALKVRPRRSCHNAQI